MSLIINDIKIVQERVVDTFINISIDLNAAILDSLILLLVVDVLISDCVNRSLLNVVKALLSVEETDVKKFET